MSSCNTKECITRRHNSFFPELAFVGQETQKIVLSNGIVVEKNVEQYRLVDNSWNNFTSEIIDIEYANDVYFYSDKSCTQSVTNDINRLVLLKRIEEARVDGVVTMYNEEDLLIEVPSGQRSYSLPNSNYYQEYQLGNETRFHEVRYVVAL